MTHDAKHTTCLDKYNLFYSYECTRVVVQSINQSTFVKRRQIGGAWRGKLGLVVVNYNLSIVSNMLTNRQWCIGVVGMLHNKW